MLSVEVTKPSASEARQAAATATEATLAALKSLVPPEDISTLDISLSPNYVYTNNVESLEGYVFRQTLQVMVKNMTAESLGAVVDAAVKAGGNAARVSSVETLMGPAKTAELTNEARKLAVANALSTAAVLAQAANVTLGPITSIVDQNQPGPVPQPMPVSAKPVESDMAVATPVAVGTQEVPASVALELAIC